MVTNLTNFENDVFELAIQGFSNKDIADKTANSLEYTKVLINNIYKKLNVHNRVQLAIYASKNQCL